MIYEIESKSASDFEPRLRISFGHDVAVSDQAAIVPSADQIKHIVDTAIYSPNPSQSTDEGPGTPPLAELEPRYGDTVPYSCDLLADLA